MATQGYDVAIEKAVGLAASCVVLAYTPVSAVIPVIAAGAVSGTALAGIFHAWARKHGIESKSTLNRIRRRAEASIEPKLQTLAALSDLDAANAVLKKHLQSCVPSREELARAFANADGRFVDQATKLVLANLAVRCPAEFGRDAPEHNFHFAEAVVRGALDASMEDQEYFQHIQPLITAELGHRLAIVDQRTESTSLALDNLTTLGQRTADNSEFLIRALADTQRMLRRHLELTAAQGFAAARPALRDSIDTALTALPAATQVGPILAHFLDHYVLMAAGYRGTGRDKINRAIASEALLALRFALQTGRQILLPAVSYFQSPIVRQARQLFPTEFRNGQITLIGDGENIRQFADLRAREYNDTEPEHRTYRRLYDGKLEVPPYEGFTGNTTGELHSMWERDLERIARAARRTAKVWSSNADDILARLPDELGERAFTAPHLVQTLEVQRLTVSTLTLMSSINRLFIEHMCAETSSSLVDDLLYIRSPVTHIFPPAFSYRQAVSALAEIPFDFRVVKSLPHEPRALL